MKVLKNMMYLNYLQNKKQKGFTMFELLIVVALIGIMITIALASFNAIRAKSRDGERIAFIKDVGLALQDYYSRCGSYPASIAYTDWDQAVPCPSSPSLQESFHGPQALVLGDFSANSNTFHVEKFGEQDFFYVPTQTLLSNGLSAVDTCDGYHLGVFLETGEHVLDTDADFNSKGVNPVFNGVQRTICSFNTAQDGYDGTHDNGGTNTVYDVVQ